MERLARAFFVLTTVVFAGEAAILGAVRLTYRDPFAPYAAIMPEHSVDGLKDYPCQLREATGTRPGSCAFNVDQPFSGRVSLEEFGHIITRTVLLIRGDQVRLGDLLVCWGKPSGLILNAPPHSDPSVEVYWGDHIYAVVSVTPSNPQITDFMTTNYISISAPPKACASGQ